MKISKRLELCLGVTLLFLFVVWTVLLKNVDVGAVGPEGSKVGFSTLNTFFHRWLGTNMQLYTITDWLGLVPIAVAFCFATLGFYQLVSRKSLWKVDRSLLALGAFYLIVIAVYVFFEYTVINYRPVLIEGRLEASYPSSTTMLVSTVMPATLIELFGRIKSKAVFRLIFAFVLAFTVFMVLGRLLSGVHWFSDIFGGILFSTGIVLTYKWVAYRK